MNFRVVFFNSVIKFLSPRDKHLNDLQSSGIEAMWTEWHQKFLSALGEVAALVCTALSNKRKLCPCMTPELMNLTHRQKSKRRRVL